MKRIVTGLALAVMLAAVPAHAQPRTVTDPEAPRSLPEEGPVAVQWNDPSEFSDLRFSGNRWEAQRGNWVFQLAEHLRDSVAKRLPEGETMEVTITDIDRAGHYEPWNGPRMHDVRILRDIYPPTIEFDFRRLDGDGNVVEEGSRRLRDLDYLRDSSFAGRNDALRHEKRLIDRWVRSEFRDTPVASR